MILSWGCETNGLTFKQLISIKDRFNQKKRETTRNRSIKKLVKCKVLRVFVPRTHAPHPFQVSPMGEKCGGCSTPPPCAQQFRILLS
jgi:hypothetical protein